MIDFLRANPFVTREEYLWEWTVPQIKLASFDFTHIKYLNTKDDKKGKRPKKPKSEKRYDNPKDLIKDLNIPII